MSEAERASAEVLLAGVAHELNTPLGAIRSNRDVLRRVVNRLSGILADDRVDRAEVEQLRQLVRKLAEVIEIDRAAVDAIGDVIVSARSCWRPDEAVMRCVDLHECLDSALLLLKHRLGSRVEVLREYGELPEIECYPSQVSQVFVNLLLNAVQAIPESGTITIRSYVKEARVAVEIRDTGTGIAGEDIKRIFEPGFSTRGTKSGMGLGLDICRQIIEEQGGAIEVRSTLGKGSTFTVWLPLRRRGETGRRDDEDPGTVDLRSD